MTNLRKGIIEINGFEISKDTTPLEIKNALSSVVKNHVHLDEGEIDLIRFSKVKILDRCFNVKMYFIYGKLSHIRLDSLNEDCLSFEELFEQDCKWMKTILGESSVSGKNGIVYLFDKYQIGVTYQLNDGRCGTDEFIDLIYERG